VVAVPNRLLVVLRVVPHLLPGILRLQEILPLWEIFLLWEILLLREVLLDFSFSPVHLVGVGWVVTLVVALALRWVDPLDWVLQLFERLLLLLLYGWFV